MFFLFLFRRANRKVQSPRIRPIWPTSFFLLGNCHRCATAVLGRLFPRSLEAHPRKIADLQTKSLLQFQFRFCEPCDSQDSVICDVKESRTAHSGKDMAAVQAEIDKNS